MVKQVQKCIAFRCARLTVPHSPEGDKTIIWLKLVLYPPIPLKLRLKSLKQIWQWKVCSRRYSQRAWTWVVGCGLSWPHKSGSSPPYCGWHSWHSSAASHKVWVEHKLQNENERNVKITTSYMGQNTKTTCEVLQEKKQQSRLQSKTLASEMSLTAAASTMFLMTNFLMALSFGTQRAQLVQRMGCTWPRPFLARPLFLLFLVCKNKCQNLREIQIAARKLGLCTKRHTFSLVHCVECTQPGSSNTAMCLKQLRTQMIFTVYSIKKKKRYSTVWTS